MSRLNAFVLLSGGLDSSALLSLAVSLNYNVTAVSFNYGQRHIKELEAAAAVAEHFKVPHIVKDMSSLIGIGGLTDKDMKMPNATYAELGHGVSPTYVPFRNGLMLSILASMASATAGKQDEEGEVRQTVIVYGAHKDDSANDAYPDCSEAFIAALNNAIQIGTYKLVTLKAPFKAKSKAQIVRVGKDNGCPFELTWSCYEGGERHCGTCPTCRARKEAFSIAQINDPTLYEDYTGAYVIPYEPPADTDTDAKVAPAPAPADKTSVQDQDQDEHEDRVND